MLALRNCDQRDAIGYRLVPKARGKRWSLVVCLIDRRMAWTNHGYFWRQKVGLRFIKSIKKYFVALRARE